MRARRAQRLTDSIYVELVRSLVVTLAPTTIMSILFIMVASLATARHSDAILSTLGVLGALASLIRVAVTLGLELRLSEPEIGFGNAARLERLFAATYLTFASLFGAFAAQVMQVSDPQVQMVAAGLTVGYAAGVAAGVALRPWISVPAVLLAVLPPALSSATTGDEAHGVLALVLFGLLSGGIGSMMRRYRSETEKIAMRHAFASLARTDHLTGLLNRFALGEAFFDKANGDCDYLTAVHCIDLDRFKPVNDAFGHPVGDKLLVQVADRLRTLCRGCDVAARLGGDEFALVQRGFQHADDARLLACRIVRSLSDEYLVDGHQIAIGASVGFALADLRGEPLQDLLARADQDLYRAKRQRSDDEWHARRGRDMAVA